MTIIPSDSPTTNRILKFILGLANFFAPYVWLMTFVFAAIFSVMLILNPAEVLPVELILCLIALISGTYTMRNSALETRTKALEKIQMQQAAGVTVAPEDLKTAESFIPAFGALLRRNAVVTLFYAPIVAIVSAMAMGILVGVMDFSQSVAENKTGFQVLIRCLVPIPLFTWVYVVGFTWGRIAQFVDRRILHTQVNLPETEEARQKRQQHEATFGTGTKSVLKSLRSGLIGTIGGLALYLILFAAPLMIVLWGVQNAPLPETAKFLILIPVLIVYPLVLLFALPNLIKRLGDKFLLRRLQQETLQQAQTPEEVEEARQLLETLNQDYQQQTHAAEASLESRIMQRGFGLFLGFFGLLFILVLGVGVGARALGVNGETAKGLMTLILGAGVVFMFVGMGKIAPHFMPKSVMEKYIPDWEAAMRRGNYDVAVRLAEQAMAELPNWETQVPGAATYAQMGRLDDAERLARDLLQQQAQMTTEAQREMSKLIMGQLFGLLTEIYLYRQRYEEADNFARQAMELQADGYSIHNTLAKLQLFRGQGQPALKHIEQAAQNYIKEGKQPSGYNLTLHAWALALLGDHPQADALMLEAFKQVPAEHRADLGELYLIGGYVARAQGKPKGARASFEKARDYDPQGINGQVAQMELEKAGE